MPCRFLLPSALLAFFCFALPAAADPAAPLPRPANLRSDILYTHKGEFVQVSPMRALTLNAHVEQFAYDPLGIEVAVAGSETTGDKTTHFVKTLDVRNGHEMSRVTAITQAEDVYGSFSLLGWSTSGRYLLLKRYSQDPKEPETALSEFIRWDLGADPPVQRKIDPEAGLPPEMRSEDLEGSADCYPSPDGRWLLFTQSIHALKDNGKPIDQNASILYDPERDTFKLLPLPPKTVFQGWSDSTHLEISQAHLSRQFDVVTGLVSPLPLDSAPAPAVSKQYPDLSLDTEARDQEDRQPTGGHFGSYVIWIRRTPFGKLPFGIAAAGLMPRPQIPEYPGRDDPKAVWSPTGKQIAFVANNDLCITDLTAEIEGHPREKLAVGLKLSCREEQALASSDLKQIGLGITQYLQDMDEQFPLAKDWVKTVYPYIKADVFEVDGHSAVYEQPADLALAKMESPADVEMAYMDLPCARVVLFCDGHVKVFPK